MKKVDLKNAQTITLTGQDISIDLVDKIAHARPGEIKLTLSKQAEKKIQKAFDYVSSIAKKDQAVYGINTGFGSLSNKQISKKDLSQLQYNLIRSHCTGVGKDFDKATTRAILFIRATSLIFGHSGVSLDLVNLMLELLNYHIHPVIPEKGSLGASGDLAPLAHMSLALIGEGEVIIDGEKKNAKEVLDFFNLKPINLLPKEGLALINGTAVMAAIGSLNISQAKKLAKLCDIVGAISVEAARGSCVAFNESIHKLKPQPGQLLSAKNLSKMLVESEISLSHKDCQKVQDPYSFRCIPQVHGAGRQAITHAESVVNIELNSVTDNPLVFPEEERIISGGNFHGQALSMCMDYMSMAMAEFCSICERRIEKLINPIFSELNAFLTPNPGLNSGLMVAHYTVAALVSENKVLSHPACVDSVPTSTDKEDHVSMGVTAGRKLTEIVNNLKDCLAIELLCSTQAIELLSPLRPSKPIDSVYQLIRNVVPPIDQDRVFSHDILAIKKLIDEDKILSVVESITGELE